MMLTPLHLVLLTVVLAAYFPVATRSDYAGFARHVGRDGDLPSAFDRFVSVQRHTGDRNPGGYQSKLVLPDEGQSTFPIRKTATPNTGHSSRRHEAHITSSQRKVYNRIRKLNTDALIKGAKATASATGAPATSDSNRSGNDDDAASSTDPNTATRSTGYAGTGRKRRAKAGVAVSHGTLSPEDQVSFQPASLSFGEHPLCSPAAMAITIINHSPVSDLHIWSATTDETHWRMGTLVPLVISPGSHTTLWMLFLPRVLGDIEGKVVLQTNMGGFVYRVRGIGIESPYKVHPFAGAMIPVGVPYNPSITIFNYHDDELIIQEVFTNEPFLQLNPPLDDDGVEVTQVPWHIAPGQKSVIASLSFVSDIPGRFIGSVMVRSNHGDLVMPFEVWVLKGGIHRSPEEIDFGVLTSPTERHSVPITLLNSGPQHILLVDIYASTADSHMHLDFKKRQILQPYVDTHVATAVYTGRTEGLFEGKLVLRTNDSNPVNSRLEIPYRARVLHGSLGHSPMETSFAVSEALEKMLRTLTVTNKFSVPLTFFGATIADACFQVESFERGTVIQPGETVDLVTLSFQPNATHHLYDVDLVLQTNASALSIPLHVYHGRLTWSVIDHSIEANANATEVNFGILGVNENRILKLNVSNENPVKVQLYAFKSSHPDILTLKLDSIWNKRGLTLSGTELSSLQSRRRSSGRSDALVTLDPGHKAVFSIELTTPREEKGKDVELEFETSFEKQMRIPVSYQSVHGSLKFNTTYIRFEPAFSGRILRKTISAVSTYSRPLEVFSAASSDSRVLVEFFKSNTQLPPGKEVVIGSVVFDASRGHVEENFMHNTDPSLLSAPGEPYTGGDIASYHRRESVWKKLVARDSTAFRASITFNTDVVQGYSLTIRGSVARPSLSKVKQVHFGLTQIGSSSEVMITAVNPADTPVHVELLSYDAVLSEKLGLDAVEENPQAFSISPEARKTAVIPAAGEIKLGPVVFQPTESGAFSVVLLLKNNLTLFDTQPIIGKGGSGILVVMSPSSQVVSRFVVNVTAEELGYHGNKNATQRARLEGSDGKLSPLQDNDVVDEDEDDWQPVEDVVSVRHFVLRNDGDLPLQIFSANVGGLACGGHGFYVEPCRTFTIQDGASVNFTISYRPDFASSQVSRTITFKTSSGDVEFGVEAMLPHNLLPVWIEAQPLSPLERMARAAIVGTASLLILIVLYVFCSDIAADRASSASAIVSADPATVSPSPATGSSGNEDAPHSSTATSKVSQVANSARASPAVSVSSTTESVLSSTEDSSSYVDKTTPVPSSSEKAGGKKKSKKDKKRKGSEKGDDVVERVSSSSSKSNASTHKASITPMHDPVPVELVPLPPVTMEDVEPLATRNKSSKSSRKNSAQDNTPSAQHSTSTSTSAPTPAVSSTTQSGHASQGTSGAEGGKGSNTQPSRKQRSNSQQSEASATSASKAASTTETTISTAANEKKNKRAKKKKERQGPSSQRDEGVKGNTSATVSQPVSGNSTPIPPNSNGSVSSSSSQYNRGNKVGSGSQSSQQHVGGSNAATTTTSWNNSNSNNNNASGNGNSNNGTSLMAAATAAAARQQRGGAAGVNHGPTHNPSSTRGGKPPRGTRGGRLNAGPGQHEAYNSSYRSSNNNTNNGSNSNSGSGGRNHHQHHRDQYENTSHGRGNHGGGRGGFTGGRGGKGNMHDKSDRHHQRQQGYGQQGQQHHNNTGARNSSAMSNRHSGHGNGPRHDAPVMPSFGGSMNPASGHMSRHGGNGGGGSGYNSGSSNGMEQQPYTTHPSSSNSSGGYGSSMFSSSHAASATSPSHQAPIDPWARAAADNTGAGASNAYPYVPPNQHSRNVPGDDSRNSYLFGASPFSQSPLFAVPASADGPGAGTSLFATSPFFTHPSDGDHTASQTPGNGQQKSNQHPDSPETASLFQAFNQFTGYDE